MRIALFTTFIVLNAFFSSQSKSQSVLPSNLSEGNNSLSKFDTGKLNSVNRFMSEAVQKQAVVGSSALVIQDGEQVFFNAWGYQDREKQIPITRNTIFRIYSMTKPVTSVAAMQLVEQGKMSLDDPVDRYLSDFRALTIYQADGRKGQGEDSHQKMTIRDLLRHTSGFTYGFFDESHPIDQIYMQGQFVDTSKDLQELVQKLSAVPLKHPPGTRFEYSVSTDVLARVIEVVSGQRFDRYLTENILSPLRMDDTSFVVPKEKRDRLATMYSDDGLGELIVSPEVVSSKFVDDSLLFFSGGGGLCSTIDDYASFARMLMNKGVSDRGQRILKAETLQQMFTDQLVGIAKPSREGMNKDAPWGQEGFSFGLGFSISQTKRGKDYTWNGIAGTQFWVNPESGTIILYMVQVFPLIGHDLAGEVRRLVYEAMK